ncbi:hypothetical protein AKJ60_00220 [candidate division MSBL1 archaeon SCGC-AAA385M11]|nr:hypothetical protein AKJ60_00220 [candidate division MSBL1 archaeon SCGC-AAA385M11]
MPHNKIPLLTLVLSLFLLLFLSSLFGCSREPILIGFSGPLTGVYSDLGVQGRNGVTLAVEEINSQGGIANRDLRLLSRDDKNSPEQSRKRDRELIAKDVVAVIGHMTSSQSVAALPVFKEAGVVLLSPTTSTPKLSGKKDMFFRVNPSSDRIARALGRFARERLGFTRLHTVRDTDNHAYTQPFTDHFIQGFKQEREKVSQKSVFSSDQLEEWSGVVDCLQQGAPQGVMIAASARDTASLCASLKRQSWQPTVLASGWAATRELLMKGGDAVEGIYLAKAGYADKEAASYQRFVRRYRERFGSNPSFPAIQGYHAAMALARALKKTGGKREGLPEALTRVKDFPSFYGQLSLNEYGDVRMPLHILRVQNGTFTVEAQIKPKAD